MGDDRLIDGLTAPQREAVTRLDGPLLVLAGAGSGKTRVITRRAALLATAVARPDEVLAITFTNKAAGEMRERILALGVGGGAWSRGRMWICTFHSLCARLLREYGQAVGVQPCYTIFDESDKRSVIREAIGAVGLSPDNWRPRTIEAAISDAKNRMLGPADYAEQARDFSEKTIARVYDEYQARLAGQNGCDFDDLLMHVATLLKNRPEIQAELSRRFRYLLIDEYQDTNHAQYQIATLLASSHRNICVTGDPDQSIYAWRGADIRNILDFEKDYPDAVTVRLEQNYRSSGAILSAASSLISNNKLRKDKTLWTEKEFGPPVRIWECEDELEEADRIAVDIQTHCAAGGAAGDAAIFYRVNAVTRVLEDALRNSGIPYQIARGVEFYNRKEIKDVIAYLRAVVNPADEVAVVRAAGTPTRGIGKVTIERLKTFASQAGISIGEAVARINEIETLKSARKKVAPFAKLIAQIRGMPPRPVGDIVEAVLLNSGLEASFRAAGDVDNNPLENVYELVSAARQYDEQNPEGSLADWLQQISLVSDTDAIELTGGSVTLMTLHAAKGLEFPIVYMVGLEEDLLPHRRAVEGADGEIEEERRLCFVGVTRAMERLTLTHARFRMIRGVTERTMASRFLAELPAEEVEYHELERTVDRSRAHRGEYNDADNEGIDVSRFQPGRTVEHPEYGRGRVLGVEARGKSVYVRIHFENEGARSFALDYATLDLIES
ncbi:MAG: UvrD-helicase domain-containing protein [Planctomycetota bacterium]|nr:UvrD-helicase domain-containing protein [Planctomycetota bacterium]